MPTRAHPEHPHRRRHHRRLRRRSTPPTRSTISSRPALAFLLLGMVALATLRPRWCTGRHSAGSASSAPCDAAAGLHRTAELLGALRLSRGGHRRRLRAGALRMWGWLAITAAAFTSLWMFLASATPARLAAGARLLCRRRLRAGGGLHRRRTLHGPPAERGRIEPVCSGCSPATWSPPPCWCYAPIMPGSR